MNALTDIVARREYDESMVGIAEARKRLEEKQKQLQRDLSLIVLGMALGAGEANRAKVLEAVSDGTGEMEVDLVLEDIRENRRERAAAFFERRGVKVDAQGSVFLSLIKSLWERFTSRRVSNAIQALRITPRGDVEAIEEALSVVRKAIGRE